MNETARELAHVFLPVAASYEKEGTFMNGERRVQRVRRAVAPPEGARTDWEIVCDVARAMGQGERFAYRTPQEIWDEIRAVWPAGAGMTYARLDRGGLQWPCPTEDAPRHRRCCTSTASRTGPGRSCAASSRTPSPRSRPPNIRSCS